MNLYRIKNWQDIYEVNRTRELKTVKWIPIPVKLSGDGYCMLMEDENGNRRKDGPAMFGAFISIVELAASCEPRGTLIRSSGEPHTFDSIGRICRISPLLISQTITFCINTVKWLEIISLNNNCDNNAGRCDVTADAPVVSCSVIPVLFSEGVVGGFEKSKHSKRSRLPFTVPTFEEFKKYCEEKGFKAIAKKAFDYYNDANPPWTDNQGREVRSWKSKLNAVWFKDENKQSTKGTDFSKLLSEGNL